MSFALLQKKIPELIELEEIITVLHRKIKVYTLTRVDWQGIELPVYALRFGPADKKAPAVVFTGGIHGLERIGSQVLLAFLHSLKERLHWDKGLQTLLSRVAVYFIPIVNPAGMAARTRSNGNGVDLMRNAPVEAAEKTPFLAGGHRLTSRLPFYRGAEGEPMQSELQALEDFYRSKILKHASIYSLDCHSGFGTRLQMWFPYASSRRPFYQAGEVYAFYELFRHSYPYHPYIWEPQSHAYLTHGDFWDYLFLSFKDYKKKTFLPLTLEMGSWLWVKKNWRQLFYPHGIFNPVLPHRLRRVLRQNMTLFEFFIQAAASEKKWFPSSPAERTAARRKALLRWHPGDYPLHTF